MCCRAVAVAVAAGFVDTQGQLTCACRFKRRRLTFAFGTGPSPPPSPSPSPELLPVRGGGEPSRLNRPRQYQYPPDEPRRPTKFTQEQLRVLSAAFDEDRFLKKTRRMTLARQLGLTESSVQGWYASQILVPWLSLLSVVGRFERARSRDEGGVASSASLSRRGRA